MNQEKPLPLTSLNKSIAIVAISIPLLLFCAKSTDSPVKFPPKGSTETLIFSIDSSIASSGVSKTAAAAIVAHAISLLRQRKVDQAAYYMTPNSPELARVTDFVKQSSDLALSAGMTGQIEKIDWEKYDLLQRGDTVCLIPQSTIATVADTAKKAELALKMYELLIIDKRYLRFNTSVLRE